MYIYSPSQTFILRALPPASTFSAFSVANNSEEWCNISTAQMTLSYYKSGRSSSSSAGMGAGAVAPASTKTTTARMVHKDPCCAFLKKFPAVHP